MTLRQLFAGLPDPAFASDAELDKDVIVVVQGAELPFPDATRVECTEDTIVIHAEVLEPEVRRGSL